MQRYTWLVLSVSFLAGCAGAGGPFYEFRPTDEPLRYAGLAMCSIFVVGLLALPFAPETKGHPLPED